MPTSAQEVYTQVVCALSPTERLRLANLILNELVKQDSSVIDQSDHWTDQDQVDFTNFSLQHTATLFPAELNQQGLV
jgi:7,8-dihydro-6-hydroxymethylpterin-pyrophosphokinase